MRLLFLAATALSVTGSALAYQTIGAGMDASLLIVFFPASQMMRVGVGRKMDWDGPNMKSTNVKKAAEFVACQARKGWELPKIA